MNSLEQISKIVSFINSRKIPLAIMHCTNVYPTPIDKSRLNSIRIMSKRFKKYNWLFRSYRWVVCLLCSN